MDEIYTDAVVRKRHSIFVLKWNIVLNFLRFLYLLSSVYENVHFIFVQFSIIPKKWKLIFWPFSIFNNSINDIHMEEQVAQSCSELSWKNFWKTKTFFKKLEYRFLVESSKIENTSFPFKTTMSEANFKINRMATTKWTYDKEWSFASKCLFFLENLL